MSRPTLTFDCGDMIATRLLLAIISICSFLPVVVTLCPGTPVEWSTAGGARREASVEGLHPGAHVHHGTELVWRVDHPTLVQRLLVALPLLVVALLAIAASVILWRLVGEVLQEQPFTAGLGRRLAFLGLLVALGPCVWAAVHVVSSWALNATLLPSPQVAWHINLVVLWPVVIGFLLLALARLVARAEVLAEDTEGLI